MAVVVATFYIPGAVGRFLGFFRQFRHTGRQPGVSILQAVFFTPDGRVIFNALFSHSRLVHWCKLDAFRIVK